MKQSAIDEEIIGIASEIDVLQQIKDRLICVRDRDEIRSSITEETKVKRGRKKKAGLPSAAPPASDANHAKGGERL